VFVILTDPTDADAVAGHLAVARQRVPAARTAGVKIARHPARLPSAPARTLACKHTLLGDPLVQRWRAAHPQAECVVLWSRVPHPREVVQVCRQHPDLEWSALYEDLRTSEFWARLQCTRGATQLVAEYQTTLLADAAQWAPPARTALERLVRNLHLTSVAEVAGQVYGGRTPGHQFTKLCRAGNHLAPKQLLLAAQLAAYRYAVERGATPLDAARAVGRPSVEHWRRAVRHALADRYPQYEQVVSADLVTRVRQLFLPGAPPDPLGVLLLDPTPPLAPRT
jgi:hypothetical protein